MSMGNNMFDDLTAFFDPDIVASCHVDEPPRPAGPDLLDPNLDLNLGYVPAPETQHYPALHHPTQLHLEENSVAPLELQGELPYQPGPFPIYNEVTEPNAEFSEPHLHVCPICNKQHVSRATLLRHMRFHNGERPFQCHACDKTFAQKGDLKVHERSHTGETPFRCSQCGKQFAQFTGFKYHKRIHSGERPVQCTQCGRAFVHTGDLNVHMRTHTGEKPFACSVCHKRFTQRGSVRVHMRRKHNQIVTKVPRTPDPGVALPHP